MAQTQFGEPWEYRETPEGGHPCNATAVCRRHNEQYAGDGREWTLFASYIHTGSTPRPDAAVRRAIQCVNLLAGIDLDNPSPITAAALALLRNANDPESNRVLLDAIRKAGW